MSKKFCPLGFFSFYVNKSEAQAGACHHCIEADCALWNEDYEECSLKVGLDAIASVAEVFSLGKVPLPERKIETPTLSILDKLRKRNIEKPLPVVETSPTTQVSPQTPLQTSPQISSQVTQESLKVQASLTQITPSSASPSPPPPPPPPPPIPTVSNKDHEDLLNPPDVPVETLPVISTSQEVKQ